MRTTSAAKIAAWPLEVWNRFWFEPGPAVRLGLARLMFCGAAFFFYLPQDFSEWASAAPIFWMPIRLFEELHLPVLSVHGLVVLQAMWKLSLALSAIGLFTRVSTIAAAIGAVYLLGLPHNFGATQHFDTLAVFALAILAVSRAGDARSLDAVLRARHRGAHPVPPRSGPEYTWPIRAMWVMTALVFFGAGTSKLRHSGLEWAFSDNLRLLLIRGYYHVSDGDPLTTWGLALAHHPMLTQLCAATALTIESFYIVALFSRRLRPYIGTFGLLFLVGIRALMGPTFETYMICSLLLLPWHRIEAFVLNRVPRPVEAPGACPPADPVVTHQEVG